MSDPRMLRLAKLLVNYSVEVKKGDWVQMRGNMVTEPLLRAIVEEIVKVGGHPTIQLTSDGIDNAFYMNASDEQLEWISPLDQIMSDDIDVRISILGSTNTRSLTGVDPMKFSKMARSRSGLMETFMRRTTDKTLRWTGSMHPTPAYAQEADMSLDAYADFVYAATFCDKEDPVAEWQKVYEEQQKIVDWLKGKDKIEIKSLNADLTLSIKGRLFVNGDGKKNMPDGEIFTGPVEDSANGWVKFTYPAITRGREVTGVRLEFKDGKVVNATADKNEDFLIQMLDTDEGSRYLGEFAFGTNYGIQKFTKSILFDEKIGGSIHLAVGASYPETLAKNKSAIHWDFICDMQEDSEVLVDGELLYKDGEFVI